MRKTKITVTLSNYVSNEIERIARKKGIPRSQAMEEILQDWLANSKREAIENEIRHYYCSVSEDEQKEDREWLKVAEKNAEGLWND
ncbi:hypothetical protein FJZ19_06080 [Candidatus Pacearchaeota archaeon]|nr:hypothetical protein [Candidatus Pacearchaeota archaeon]